MRWVVEYTPQAVAHITEAARWWAQHRSVRFEDGLEALAKRLEHDVFIGPMYTRKDGLPVHRALVMPQGTKANYHLYWKVIQARETVVVLTIQHAMSIGNPQIGE